MSYIIELFIFSLFIFIDNGFARGFNESCGLDKPSCIDPLKCIHGFCLCSLLGITTDKNNPLAFWTGDQCITCPVDYMNTGKDNQMNWERARTRCQEDSGDLLVLRSQIEFTYFSIIISLNVKEDDMFQRSPQNGTKFASIWIGAKLADWSGEGRFDLVSHGPVLTKNSFYWCSQGSPLGQEPNYIGLKETGERQECIGLAVFPNKHVCMHDWFCSWESYVLCEIHPPPPLPQSNITIETASGPEALEEKLNDTWFHMGIVGVILFLLLISICAFYFICCKKKNVRRTQSFDSAESESSQN